MGYPAASMARGDGPASQAFDPLEMLESAADLVDPVAAAISARFALESTELVVDAMDRPGPLTVLGTPIDLAKVDCDSFHIAGYTDHITPWRAAYTSTQVLGGGKQMAVVKSGHIQSFVNPPAKSRYGYWQGPPASGDPDQWLAGATEHHGSWWPQWLQWLTARSGPEKTPASAPGSRKYPPLGPAPGTYVHQ